MATTATAIRIRRLTKLRARKTANAKFPKNEIDVKILPFVDFTKADRIDSDPMFFQARYIVASNPQMKNVSSSSWSTPFIAVRRNLNGRPSTRGGNICAVKRLPPNTAIKNVKIELCGYSRLQTESSGFRLEADDVMAR